MAAEEGAHRAFTGSADDYFAVTPDDDDDLPVVVRGLLISVGGALRVDKPNGVTVDLVVPAGQFNGRVVRVHDTGTDCTGITGLV